MWAAWCLKVVIAEMVHNIVVDDFPFLCVPVQLHSLSIKRRRIAVNLGLLGPSSPGGNVGGGGGGGSGAATGAAATHLAAAAYTCSPQALQSTLRCGSPLQMTLSNTPVYFLSP